jgi:prepilin-type N-terminal cleavage/methylation domain-containing protein
MPHKIRNNQKNFNNISQQTITNFNLTNRVIWRHDNLCCLLGVTIDRKMNGNKSAFTLIELMVVVVIIVLLATLGGFAYFGAMQSARETKTIGTITKLDAAIADIYERYEFRFEHIEDSLDELSQGTWNTNKATIPEADIARLKRLLMYDLMRMEMPSSRAEVISAPPEAITVAGQSYSLEPPAVLAVYSEICNNASAGSGDLSTESAELLYLIIANLYPEALENFAPTEIGDTDNNDLLEFIDGWGNPITFIRFAPGLTNTERQPDLVQRVSAGSTNPFPHEPECRAIMFPGANVTERNEIIRQWQDPFDPDILNGESWFLYPVVMSAGRDGIIGVVTSTTGVPSNPFAAGVVIGLPTDQKDGQTIGFKHYDNIHNHSNFR